MKEANYQLNKGLENSNPKWYTYRLSSDTIEWDHYVSRYFSIIEWLYQTIDRCDKHVVWGTTQPDHDMIIRFRYEKDFLMFMMVWA